MRAISSFPVVGELLPPINCQPLVGLLKMPALSRAVASGAIMHSGIVLLGKGLPGTIPAGAVPPGQFAPRPTTPVGTTIFRVLPLASVVGITAPVPAPLASGYMLASGVVTLNSPPVTYLRHSML